MKTILNLLILILFSLPLYSQTVSADIVEVNVPVERRGSSNEDFESFMKENGEGYSYITEQGRHIHLWIYDGNVLISKWNGDVVYMFDQFLESKRYYTGQHTKENGEQIPYEFTIDFIFVKDEFIRVFMGDILIFQIENLKPIKE
jgi:hypothetical protein